METDLSLVNAVKQTGSSEAMSELIARHSGIYCQILDDYLPAEKFPVQKEDLRREKDFHIFQAVQSYRPETNMKFPVYLGQTIKWKCQTLKTKGKDRFNVSFESLNFSPQEEEKPSWDGKIQIEEIFNYAENYPNDLARKIINMRYITGKRMPWKKIAKELDISVSWATSIHTQFVKDAREHFSQSPQ